MAHTRSWDETNPDSSDKVGLGYQDIQYLRVDARERMNVETLMNINTTVDGISRNDFIVSTSIPAGNTSHVIDASNGRTHVLTLANTATCTITLPSTLTTGRGYVLTIVLKQDGTGGHVVAWGSSVKWPYNTAPIPDTTANTTTVMQFISFDGGTIWDGAMYGTKFASS